MFFCFESREYLETGDNAARLAGNAPFIIDKNSGEIYDLGTTWPLEKYLKDYEESKKHEATLTRMRLTMITKTELNVLKVMAEKDINWNWMNLDRALSIKKIPGFSNVVNIVNKLASEGLVNIEDSGNKSMPYYRVSEKGSRLIKNTDADNNVP